MSLTTGLLNLRDYQSEAIKAVSDAWTTMQRPAVLLPTGSGKTVIFSHMISHSLYLWGAREEHGWAPVRRALILVHRDELADQAIDKLRQIAPTLHVGKVKAKDNEVGAQVIVASVQTLARQSRLDQLLESEEAFGKIGLVIVDECHHAVAESYKRIMRALGCFDDHYDEETSTLTVGFTATMARGDGVGLGKVWQKVVYSKSVAWMIAKGYLVDVRAKTVDLDGLDLSQVKRSGGDYQPKALGEAIMTASGPEVISRALREHAPGLKTMVFLPDVASSVATLYALRKDGWSADIITGQTPREDRRLIFKKTMTGDTQVLVNCMVLTEGTDLPWMECAMIARPTRSEPLFIQMVGRIMRTWLLSDGTEKGDALVLLLNGAGGSIRTLADLSPGDVRTVKPTETLAEAIIREAEEAETIEYHSDNLAFCLKHKDVDLFKASSRLWLRSRAGVMFIPYGKGFVFLWPRKDGPNWDVCGVLPNRDRWKKFVEDLPLGTAQAWAETVVEDTTGGTISFVDSRWRSDPATPRQMGKARSLRVPFEGTPRKGWLSDQINIAQASAVFDRYVVRN